MRPRSTSNRNRTGLITWQRYLRTEGYLRCHCRQSENRLHQLNAKHSDGTGNQPLRLLSERTGVGAPTFYPVDMVTERLIEPVLVELGSVWPAGDAGIAEEHFYTSWVRNRLGARFHHAAGQARDVRILCACLPGSYHEIGLLLFSLWIPHCRGLAGAWLPCAGLRRW